jgi:hypothetical protein
MPDSRRGGDRRSVGLHNWGLDSLNEPVEPHSRAAWHVSGTLGVFATGRRFCSDDRELAEFNNC